MTRLTSNQLKTYKFYDAESGGWTQLMESGRLKAYTPRLDEYSEHYNKGMQEQQRISEQYTIPSDTSKIITVNAPGTPIHLANFPTNRLDSIVKNNHRLGNPLTMEEATGLALLETKGGMYQWYTDRFDKKMLHPATMAIPVERLLNSNSYSWLSFTPTASDLGYANLKTINEGNIFNRPMIAKDAGILIGDTLDRKRAHALNDFLTKSGQHPKTSYVIPDPYKYCFSEYKRGAYNNGDPDHTRMIQECGRAWLNSKLGKEWRRATGDAYNNGTLK